MNITLPSEEIIAIPEDIGTLEQIKEHVEAVCGITKLHQRLFAGDVEVVDQLLFDTLPHDQPLQLVIAIGDRYCISRANHDHGLPCANDFVPIQSTLAHRDIAALTAPPAIEVALMGQTDTGRDLAEPYLSAFQADRKSRLTRLAQIRAQLDDGPVVLSMFNWGYRHMFENWVVSCERRNINSRSCTLIFPTDAQADVLARRMGFQTYFDGHSYGEIPVEANQQFGDEDFRRIIFAKIAMVQDMLEIDGDYIRQDMDMVWYRDPRDDLQKTADRESLDMMFMYDGPGVINQPLNYNSGFIYLKNNAFTRYAWDQVFTNYGQILVEGKEQRLINTIVSYLREKGLRTAQLAEMEYTNGHLLVNGGTVPKSSILAHMSWTANIEVKIQSMKRLGVWYL